MSILLFFTYKIAVRSDLILFLSLFPVRLPDLRQDKRHHPILRGLHGPRKGIKWKRYLLKKTEKNLFNIVLRAGKQSMCASVTESQALKNIIFAFLP